MASHELSTPLVWPSWHTIGRHVCAMRRRRGAPAHAPWARTMRWAVRREAWASGSQADTLVRPPAPHTQAELATTVGAIEPLSPLAYQVLNRKRHYVLDKAAEKLNDPVRANMYAALPVSRQIWYSMLDALLRKHFLNKKLSCQSTPRAFHCYNFTKFRTIPGTVLGTVLGTVPGST